MVGDEFNLPDDHTAKTRRDDVLSKSLAQQSTLRASASQQETPADSTQPSRTPPDNIDHFEIRRRLGFGGFGSVYLAHDTKLDRMVALKLLDKLDRRAARRMLDEETRAASKLRHPHLVTVFQSGEHPLGCYIVFEQIPGADRQRAPTLREVLKEQKRLPPKAAVSIARHIASALGHAHDADVVHRDVKPENILLDDKGSAFLADFGCARRSRRHGAGVRSFVGTFPYMSLEQMEGQANSQTDIWSLGVVLYEMLNGARPFAFAEKAKSRSAAEATFGFAAAIVALEQLPPISDVDADLNAICRKCLQTDLEERYQTASEVVEDLTRWQRNEPVSCRRVGVVEQTRRWAQRNPLVATLLTTLALVLAIGFTVSTYFSIQMWTARQRYVDEQLAQLDQLDGANFDSAISNLQHEPFRPMAIQSLASGWQTADDEKLGNRMAAALVALQQPTANSPPDPALLEQARERLWAALLKTKTPAEFSLIRRYADPRTLNDEQRIASLWEAARDASDPATQFRSLSALADYDPSGTAWHDLAPVLTRRLLEQDEQQIADWASNVSGLADRLVPLLKAELNDVNEVRKTKAAVAYAVLANTPLELAKRVVTEQSPGVVRELLLQIKSRSASTQQALELLDQLELPATGVTARQVANLSVYRLVLHGSDVLDRLPLFHAESDPLARYLFEVDATDYGLDPSSMLNWIGKLQSKNSNHANAIRTAVLAMGSTDLEAIPATQRQSVVDRVTTIYREFPSATVHSAAEYVLRSWNGALPQIEVEEPKLDQGDSWRVNRLGQVLVQVELPEGTRAEITAHEVTLGDYLAYVRSRADHYGSERRLLSWIREPIKRHLNETTSSRDEATDTSATEPEDRLTDPELQLPVRHVTALQAVAYCVWVSQSEGIGDDQQAYRVREGLQEEGETLLEALEQQLGQNSSPLATCDAHAPAYRLPFSEEWESLFAEPAIARLDGQLRDEFGWYRSNSELQIQPVAAKRPQRLGFFDVWGNVTEWTMAGLAETHVKFEALGPSYESAWGDLRPIEPRIEVFGGHRTIGFRMIRPLP